MGVFQDNLLAGKTAFIAGGTSGINLGIAKSFARRATTTARIANVGCNSRGQFVSEADVCGLGMNRIYDVNAPESRACKAGKPTGFWALSSAERAYIRNPANCAARGIR